ncbi:CwfJ C-terminus 1-domain-containing protein-like protein [Mycena leptocephala]|nr:CwfJ C-terminus 1-domain-containing protein-like protein [Mycena leptocephala]
MLMEVDGHLFPNHDIPPLHFLSPTAPCPSRFRSTSPQLDVHLFLSWAPFVDVTAAIEALAAAIQVFKPKHPLATTIPTAESLKLTSSALSKEITLKRDDWMLLPPSEPVLPAATPRRVQLPSGDESFTEDYGESSQDQRTLGDIKKKRADKPDPNQASRLHPIINPKELNVDIKEGRPIDHDVPAPPPKAVTPGGPGSQWRMMRLKRVYETAEEEGLSIEQVAVDRFGSSLHLRKQRRSRILDDGRVGVQTEVEMTEERRRRKWSIDTLSASNPVPANRRLDSLRLPSQTRALSPSSLNRLQAKVLRAKLMGAPDADALEREYETESHGHGRLYDVGHGAEEEPALPGNRKKKEKFETHDPKTGEILRYNANDDTTTLGEMLRQEHQKNLDAEFARSIMSDGKFQKLGRQKMLGCHERHLAECHFCFGEDDSPPKGPVIAMGTRAYLSCTTNEELVKGHCLINDEVWDEVRNFMKCLMRMFAEDDQGVIFYETVISLKWQKHTCIECVPLPWDQYEDIPQYFKYSWHEKQISDVHFLCDISDYPSNLESPLPPNQLCLGSSFDFGIQVSAQILSSFPLLTRRKWSQPGILLNL